MFFYQRKIKHVEVRRFRFRDEWGKLHDLEVIKAQLEPEPTDTELQDQLHSTALWVRKYDD